jgi:hypothetical protein
MREPAILTIRQAFGNRAALARRQPGVAGVATPPAWLDQRRKFGQYPALCGLALPPKVLMVRDPR